MFKSDDYSRQNTAPVATLARAPNRNACPLYAKLMLQYKIGKIMRARGDCQGRPPVTAFTATMARQNQVNISIMGWPFDVFANPARPFTNQSHGLPLKKAVPMRPLTCFHIMYFETPRKGVS